MKKSVSSYCGPKFIDIVTLIQIAVEKKRIALDQLSVIERQFATFRDRSVYSFVVMDIANFLAGSTMSDSRH